MRREYLHNLPHCHTSRLFDMSAYLITFVQDIGRTSYLRRSSGYVQFGRWFQHPSLSPFWASSSVLVAPSCGAWCPSNTVNEYSILRYIQTAPLGSVNTSNAIAPAHPLQTPLRLPKKNPHHKKKLIRLQIQSLYSSEIGVRGLLCSRTDNRALKSATSASNDG